MNKKEKKRRRWDEKNC